MTLLSVKNLKTSFFTSRGEVQAVRGVSFDVRPGEILGIVGESGSGKSITCMSVLRLLKSSGRVVGGEALFEGRDLLKLDDDDLRQLRGNEIAMIFQDPMTSLNPTLTVGEQVMETILRHRKVTRAEARQRVIELFELVRIPNAAQRLRAYPHQFSGGMRQRVMIAMALSCDPKLLIADEPTTALDVTIQRQILALLKELQSRLGMAVILITHDLGVIAEVTDRVLVMYGGMAMEQGPVREVFARPSHPYTRGLLSSIPDLRDGEHHRLTPIPGSPPDMLRPPPGCPFAPRCPHTMAQCIAAVPPLFEIGSAHEARCWLHHPDAPKVLGEMEAAQ
ncbi:ABC transporter ATP-binding protein [Paradevosia shaoguanensis]|uniref:ABC transporter ATP-binding protein n=1 Tax=Paradevosia shaoguanensis TaxID=1335043 RepID=A0AA41UBX2_9HYPH|nr:ABC transporter ATP-binding protein [Paradevosia shaoguanensis]MCF1741171.1 ABC transporter ATP-binding protein [Paradevosia shaoguanensis]MCI0125654.1 ABC transporter ATP-binding protein [Paradevosia shaoguanensis]